MSNLSQVLVGLQRERKRMQDEIRSLDGAIGALKGLTTRGNGGGLGRPRLSLAARRRIAAAQRARWAKVRQQKKAAA
jgi:hypothetical protein